MRWYLSGSSWRVAGSIATLAHQLDAIWPKRQPTDGTVGDLSHQARRSDHNPNDARVVTAIDVGIEGSQGSQLVGALVAAADRRVKYIIHNGGIWRSYDKPGLPAWTRAPYTGSNPHKTHVHVSVSSTAAVYDNTARWTLGNLDVIPPPSPSTGGDPIVTRLPTLRLRDGFDAGRPELRDDVRRLQALLAIAGIVAAQTFGADHRPDGLFGAGTESAVKALQAREGLAVDGIVGESTWTILLGLDDQ